MTKYYFISYICQRDCNMIYGHAMIKITNKSLGYICNCLAKYNDVSPDSIIITYLKDLPKEEYGMLKGDEE